LTQFYDWIFRNDDEDQIVLYSGESMYRLRDLKREIDRFESLLSEQGGVYGKKVGILIPYLFSYLSLIVAVNRLGGIVVPLSWQYRSQDLSDVLQTVDPHIVFTVAEHNGFLFAESIRRWASASGSKTDIYEKAGERASEKLTVIDGRERPPEPQRIDLIGCTSGSTGVPKGIMLTADALSHWSRYLLSVTRLKSSDCIFQTLSPTAPFGIVWLLSAISVRAKTVATAQLDIPQMIEWLDRYPCNIVSSTPTVFRVLHTFAKIRKPSVFNALDLCIVTGEPITSDFVCAVSDMLPCRMMSTYGLSELGVLMYTPGDLRHGIEWQVCPDIGYEISEMNEEGIGEIVFHSPLETFLGYYKRDDLTRAAYKTAGWFLTGDLVKLNDNGNIEIVGRSKDLIKKGGQPIVPGEVEHCIEQFSNVKQAVVVGIPHSIMGEEIAAFIVPEGHLDIEKLRDHCVHSIAAYKVPDRFAIVDRIPVVQGKTDKVSLKNMIAASQQTGVSI
jgi:long-chain acyl-CoA synthetase